MCGKYKRHGFLPVPPGRQKPQTEYHPRLLRLLVFPSPTQGSPSRFLGSKACACRVVLFASFQGYYPILAVRSIWETHLAGIVAFGTLAMTSSLVLGLDAHGTTETHFEEPVHRSKPDHSTLYGGENQGYEKRRGSIHNSSSNGLTRTISAGVDVERAELDFAQLNRQFSAYSELGRQISKQQTGQHPVAKANDVEKQIKSDESSAEPWDLEATLRGASAADREAGIKVKRIGASRIFAYRLASA